MWWDLWQARKKSEVFNQIFIHKVWRAERIRLKEIESGVGAGFSLGEYSFLCCDTMKSGRQ